MVDSEHFGAIYMIVWRLVAKCWCISTFYVFFLDHSVHQHLCHFTAVACSYYCTELSSALWHQADYLVCVKRSFVLRRSCVFSTCVELVHVREWFTGQNRSSVGPSSTGCCQCHTKSISRFFSRQICLVFSKQHFFHFILCIRIFQWFYVAAWQAHVCVTTCPKMYAIPVSQFALLANVSKRYCFCFMRLQRFYDNWIFYAPFIKALTCLITLIWYHWGWRHYVNTN